MAPDQYRAKDCKSEAYHLYVYLSESSAQFGTVIRDCSSSTNV